MSSVYKRAGLWLCLLAAAGITLWLFARPAQASGTGTTISVLLSQSSIAADGTSTTTDTATVDDSNGGVAGDTVKFTSRDGGETISGTTDNNNGTYTATIRSSTTVGTATITATDSTSMPSGAPLTATASLTQTAGPAATVTVALSPNSIVANGTATTTATATVEDAQGHVLSGENVSWSSSDAGNKFSAQNASTTTITSSTTVGTPTITATDGSASGNATLTQTAGPAATVTVALNPTSIIANGTTTTTATATVKDAQGHLLPTETVTFTSSDTGDKFSATTNAGSGTYTATITSSTTVGTPTITATDGTVSGTATLTQTAGSAATVQVAASPAVILANGTSTATVTATVEDAQGHLLTGQSVSFKSTDSGEFFGQVSDNGNGTYTVQVRSSTTVGSATITATDSTASPAISGQGTLGQAAGPSTTSLVASSSTLVTNQSLTLFATVNGGPGAPSGGITFNDGGVPIANCVTEPITPSNPGATCQTSFAAATSPEQLTAVFIPNSKSTAPGSSGAITVTVTPDSTSVSLQASTTVNLGQSTTFTATVAPPASRSGPVEPSGSVEFFDAGKPIPSCLNQALVSLSATCTLTYSALGTHSITALYGGDSNFTGSTTQAQPVAVVPDPVPVLGRINSTMQWTFAYARSYTKVVALSINWVSSAATVSLKCHGRGCPFVTRTRTVAKPKQCGKKGKPKCPTGGSINLAAPFEKDPLHPRGTIVVMIRRSGWVGKYYKFTIRAGNQPIIQISCLAPGHTTPGVGC
ncbi:MAG: invasin domain 3-containing protein [Solirubrobacteraceae bacterium]